MEDGPIGCMKGMDIDRNAMFRHLYDMWMAAKAGRNGTALCERLGIRKQNVSGFRTAKDGRVAPWWALNRMLVDLNMEYRVTEVGVVLTSRRGRGPGGPATKQGDVVILHTPPPPE